jgi:hypothetical protein
MREYVDFNDIAGVLRNDQRAYFSKVFALAKRKLSMREFAIVLRAKERGVAAKGIVGRLIPMSVNAHQFLH